MTIGYDPSSSSFRVAGARHVRFVGADDIDLGGAAVKGAAPARTRRGTGRAAPGAAGVGVTAEISFDERPPEGSTTVVTPHWPTRFGVTRTARGFVVELTHPPDPPRRSTGSSCREHAYAAHSVRKRRLLERLAEAERRAAHAEERAVRAEAEVTRLREAIDALPHAVVLCDAAGEVVLRNRQSLELEGGRHAAALVDRAVEEVVAAGEGIRPVTQTLELRGPPPRSLQVTASPMGRNALRLGTVVLVDDVSELRRLEAVRRDFVANVSHELRTPVGAMAVLAETLADEQDPAVMRRLAERITAEAERAGALIDGLLDLSRIEAGGVHARRRVYVTAVVAAAAERVGPLAVQREVALVVGPVAAPGLAVEGDETQLTSAVANLLSNAVKYSDERSEVHVQVRAAQPGWVDLTVRDRGIGIPAKDLERIFERFYRVDRARSRETGGSGLGLSIVRHVATNHGGEVLVESEEGLGSTFTLRLPSA